MVCFFLKREDGWQKNKARYEISNTEIELNGKFVKPPEIIIQASIPTAILKGQYKGIEKEQLAIAYIHGHNKNLRRGDTSINYDPNDQQILAKMAQARSTIDKCVDKENGFMSENDSNKEIVFVNGKGSKFGTVTGLLRDWVVYIKPLYAVLIILLVWIAREVFPSVWQWLVKITAPYVPWW